MTEKPVNKYVMWWKHLCQILQNIFSLYIQLNIWTQGYYDVKSEEQKSRLFATYKVAYKTLSHSNFVQLLNFSQHFNKLPSSPHHWHNGGVLQSRVISKNYCTHQHSLNTIKTQNKWFKILCATLHLLVIWWTDIFRCAQWNHSAQVIIKYLSQ